PASASPASCSPTRSARSTGARAGHGSRRGLLGPWSARSSHASSRSSGELPSAAGGSYSLIRPDVPRPPFLETDEDEPVSKRSRIRVSMYHLPWIVIPSVVADDRGRTRRLLAPPARESS